MTSRTIEVLNINHPSSRRMVDAAMYEAMRNAILKVLPDRKPGMTIDEMVKRLPPHLPESLYPGGAKAGWWAKTVQLDLEARRAIRREPTRPLRLHRGEARG